jgi:hypothetical protein
LNLVKIAEPNELFKGIFPPKTINFALYWTGKWLPAPPPFWAFLRSKQQQKSQFFSTSLKKYAFFSENTKKPINLDNHSILEAN